MGAILDLWYIQWKGDGLHYHETLVEPVRRCTRHFHTFTLQKSSRDLGYQNSNSATFLAIHWFFILSWTIFCCMLLNIYPTGNYSFTKVEVLFCCQRFNTCMIYMGLRHWSRLGGWSKLETSLFGSLLCLSILRSWLGPWVHCAWSRGPHKRARCLEALRGFAWV